MNFNDLFKPLSHYEIYGSVYSLLSEGDQAFLASNSWGMTDEQREASKKRMAEITEKCRKICDRLIADKEI